MKLTLLAAAMCGAIALAGCSSLSSKDPALEGTALELPECDGIYDKCRKTTTYYNEPSPELNDLPGLPNSALDIKYGQGKISRAVTVAPYDRGFISGEVIQTIYDYNDQPVQQIVAPFAFGALNGEVKTYAFVTNQDGELVKQLKSSEVWIKGVKKETLAELKPYMTAQDLAYFEQPFPPLCDQADDQITGCVFREIDGVPKIIGMPNSLVFYKNGEKDLTFSIKQAAVGSKEIDGIMYFSDRYYDDAAPWLGLDDFMGRIYDIHRLDKEGHTAERWGFNSDGSLCSVLKNREYLYQSYKN